MGKEDVLMVPEQLEQYSSVVPPGHHRLRSMRDGTVCGLGLLLGCFKRRGWPEGYEFDEAVETMREYAATLGINFGEIEAASELLLESGSVDRGLSVGGHS